MKTNKLLITAIASAFLAAGGVSFAVAQSATNQQTATNHEPRAESRAEHHRFEQHAFARPTERVEARLAYLKTALKITAAQEPQWDAYSNSMRQGAKEMEQKINAWRSAKEARPEHHRANAIEHLERAQAFHAGAVTRINELLAVEKPLYAALSPEQQKVADVVLNKRMGGHERSSKHGQGGFGRG